ncbi:MAG: class I SAM-dependent methyltransferase [Myxococcota bacterium]
MLTIAITGALASDHGHGDHATMSHRFEDPAQWVARFEDPSREAWQRPAELVAALKLRPGDTVADIGAGTGYFNGRLAAAVGPGGRVIAVDIEPTLVAYMAERAKRDGTSQVEARLGAADDARLAPGEADLVLIVNTYHHVDARVAYFQRLLAGVKAGGRVVVVDFDPAGPEEIGPPKAHRIAPEKVREELTAAGWTFVESLAVVPGEYVLVFRK